LAGRERRKKHAGEKNSDSLSEVPCSMLRYPDGAEV